LTCPAGTLIIKTVMTNYGIDWQNIDMNSAYETSLELVDGLTFDTLLLEIGCNCREINEKTVTEQFEADLERIVSSARDIFKANLKNIVEKARETRDSD
jgi:hypothetical protein